MIDWLLFVPACFALNLAFGPNNLLAMTNGATRGVRFAQVAALGRLAVFVPMIAVSAAGLSVVLSASATLFHAVKIAGAAYLVYLGVRLWKSAARAEAPGGADAAQTLAGAVRSEALVAVANPKAILIFAAFFPQFVASDAYWTSYAMLGAAFLFLEAIAACAYAVAGRYAVRAATQRLSMVQRVSGLMMGVFGVLLLFSPEPQKRP